MLSRYLLLVLFAVLGCTKSVAELDAFLNPSEIGEEGPTVRATIRFTDVKTAQEQDALHLRFSNPEGDEMEFVLRLADSSLVADTYDIDGQTHEFSSSFTTQAEGSSSRLEVTSERGELRLTSVDIEGGFLQSLVGSFVVNFVQGGSGDGQIDFHSGG